MQALAPDTIIHERYHVQSLLGQGGMSRVYLATDDRLNVLVAIKENLQDDPQARTQFRREAELLAHLSHPHLPRVTDYFDDAATGRQYLVMDYVDGQDLGAIVSSQGPLAEKQAVAYIVQILDALDYLHHQKPPIIHRDIKPSNIKITPEGKAVLVDFGISKAYDATVVTVTGARAVTPGFAPPEQYGMRTDARSDVYAVGATLYTLLTGKIPPESTLRVANLATVPALHTVVPNVSPQVEQAVQLAMEPDTTKRWDGAETFKQALTNPMPTVPPRISLDMPTVAPVKPKSPAPAVAASFPQRSLKWPVIGLIAVLALLLGGGGLVLANTAGVTLFGPAKQLAESQPPATTTTTTTSPATAVAIAPTATPMPSATTDFAATQTAIAVNFQATLTTQASGFAATQTAAAVAVAVKPTATVVVPTATPALSAATPTATLTASTTKPTATAQAAASTLTPTPVPPITTPTALASNFVAITNVRIDPANPLYNQMLTFFVTFNNTYTIMQQRTWSIYVFRSDDLKKSFWHSKSQTSSLPIGPVELPNLPNDTLRVNGTGPVLNFLIYIKDDGTGQYLPGPDGQTYVKSFTVSP